MKMSSSIHLWSTALEGLVALGPEISGVPFWTWAWMGGTRERADAEPMVLVTVGPNLRQRVAARVVLRPEVAVLDGPAIEVDEAFERLATWLEANRETIAGYWFQLDATTPADFLAQIRPVPPSLPRWSVSMAAAGRALPVGVGGH